MENTTGYYGSQLESLVQHRGTAAGQGQSKLKPPFGLLDSLGSVSNSQPNLAPSIAVRIKVGRWTMHTARAR